MAPFRSRSMLLRLTPIVLAILTTLLLVSVFRRTSWRGILQAVDLDEVYGPTEEEMASGRNMLPGMRLSRPDAKRPWAGSKDSKIESTSPYPQGETKPTEEEMASGRDMLPGLRLDRPDAKRPWAGSKDSKIESTSPPYPQGETKPTEEEMASGTNMLPGMRLGRPDAKRPWAYSKDPKIESTSPYPQGETKPAGEEYSRALVLARLQDENITWVQAQLGDMLAPNGPLEAAIYVVDDPAAPLHPPTNKGNEVMVYLTYILDRYDSLPDISIFMHAHRFAWHNNDMMETDSAVMLRLLSPAHVARHGYMNLRCQWEPGCPAWMQPGTALRKSTETEEQFVADAWAELFPHDAQPAVLAQPCCSQFAVTRQRIRATPRQRYAALRDWLLRTDVPDHYSGRIFEYVWQFVFTLAPVVCPSMAACHCDGYGFCFGGADAFDYWFELHFRRDKLKEELMERWGTDDVVEVAKLVGAVSEETVLEVPEVGRDEWLLGEMGRLTGEMESRKVEALERGRSARNRALEAGREWREGDGF